MKKRFGVAVLVILLALPLILARTGPCILGAGGQKEVCFHTFSISSSDGFGAAEVCGDCYVCGDSDGVCPEDFMNATLPNAVGDCSGCNDADCHANISGHVYKRDMLNLYGHLVPVVHAQVKSVPQNPLVPENVVLTDDDGFYDLGVPNGNLIVSAASIGLDTEINETTMYSRDDKIMDFFLPNASCDENCTNYFGRCNKDCQGVNNCNYADWDESKRFSEVAWLCHERRFGETVVVSEGEDYANSTVCCDGSVHIIEFRPQVAVGGDMKNLITTSTNALYNGIPVTITVATWVPKG
jgi:hypothetical protein